MVRTCRLLTAAAAAVCLHAQAPMKIEPATFGALEARAIGPAAMSGRITSLAGNPRDSRILYVGSAGGGVWKTVNGGTTFKPAFDRYTQSIGAVALDPQKPETVWVGTGEPWTRNSVSVGTGVYRSTDGGENWQFMGLPASERVSKIVVDPKNSNTVYVAVPGKLWSAGEERGLYKTGDGGKTWKRILYVDDTTGCSDVDIDPQEPQNLVAGMWTFRRTAWSFQSGGKGSGLYRSGDGGATWTRITDGMPEGELGRIAVAVAPSRPSTIYATVEAKKTVLLRSDDAGRTWQTVNTGANVGERPFYFSLLVADPADYKRIYKPGLLLYASPDGGKTFGTLGVSLAGLPYHPDIHALWIDPRQTETMYLGTDGGVYRTVDRGGTWNFLRNLPVSQFYHVSADMSRPFRVYGGLQDNGTWAGPSESPGGVKNRDWSSVGIGDGFYAWPHAKDDNIIYVQYQGGKLLRFHRQTREIKSIAPAARPGEPKLRFNWNAAVALSPSQPDALYIGAQYLYRSRDRGESWERISPDLTTNNPEKQKQNQSGGVTLDNSTAENHCTILAVAESPREPNVIWAGTDDGNVQLTRDGGKTWTDLTARLAGAPRFAFVSSIEPGRTAAGTAYVTFDAHMQGDMGTHVFRTTDYGQSWTRLATQGVEGFAHVIRADILKPELLYLGTEFGLFLTLDGGQNWARFSALPNAAVRDVFVHPRDHAVIAATHGRGLYVLDDLAPLRQLTPAILESDWTVLESAPARIRPQAVAQEYSGSDEFAGANPPEMAWINYWLKERQMTGDFSIEVLDAEGKLVTKLGAGTRRGLNRVRWAMRLRPPRVATGGGLETGSLTGPVAPEGVYTARLTREGVTKTIPIHVVADPRSPWPEADRKLQQTTILRLYRQIERLAYVGAAAADLRDQARKGAKENEPLAAALDKLIGTLAIQRAVGQGAADVESRIRERAGTLYAEISRFGGRPAASQMDALAGVEKEIDAAAAQFDKLTAQLPAGLRRLTREEFERRQ